MLGDCIIRTGVIQFDLGRKGPAGFSYKEGLHGLGRPAPEIRALMEKLQTRTNKASLKEALMSSLRLLQRTCPHQTSYLGKQHDRLYKSNYTHTHRLSKSCGNYDGRLGLCNQSCEDLGCDSRFLEHRERPDTDISPVIHFGCYGSSNTVLKSAMERDDLAKNDIIDFEMEGSGVWEVCPMVIIKSACDYADSHKNKRWQRYAAAVAAATTKAFLQEFKTSDDQQWVDQLHDHIHAAATSATQFESDNNVDNAIRIADAAIRNYYNSGNRLQIECLSGEKLSLDKCYINLALVDQSKENAKESPSFSLEARLKLDAGSIRELVPLECLFEPRKLCSGTVGTP